VFIEGYIENKIFKYNCFFNSLKKSQKDLSKMKKYYLKKGANVKVWGIQNKNTLTYYNYVVR
jgi:hypothetical protein